MAVMIIKSVNEKVREWKGEKGIFHFISGTFEDGTQWSIGAKPDNSQTRLAELQALVGKTGEYELQEDGEWQGVKKWKIKSWPGKPQGGGGGGGYGGGKRDWQPRWVDTPEAEQIKRDSIHRQTALIQAVAYASNRDISEDKLVALADRLYAWINAAPPQAQAAVTAIKATTPGVTTGDKLLDAVFPKAMDAIPKIERLSELIQRYDSLHECFVDKVLEWDEYRKIGEAVAKRTLELCPNMKDPAQAFKAGYDLLKKMQANKALIEEKFFWFGTRLDAAKDQWNSKMELEARFGGGPE